jgi:hypothetical protein
MKKMTDSSVKMLVHRISSTWWGVGLAQD